MHQRKAPLIDCHASGCVYVCVGHVAHMPTGCDEQAVNVFSGLCFRVLYRAHAAIMVLVCEEKTLALARCSGNKCSGRRASAGVCVCYCVQRSWHRTASTPHNSVYFLLLPAASSTGKFAPLAGNLQHWRASQAKSALKAAPVHEFAIPIKQKAPQCGAPCLLLKRTQLNRA